MKPVVMFNLCFNRLLFCFQLPQDAEISMVAAIHLLQNKEKCYISRVKCYISRNGLLHIKELLLHIKATRKKLSTISVAMLQIKELIKWPF